MAAEGMQVPWRWNGGSIYPNLGVTRRMSVDSIVQRRILPKYHLKLISCVTLQLTGELPRENPAVGDREVAPYTEKCRSKVRAVSHIEGR